MSEKSKNILLGVLIVGLVSMTVAYAALTTNLKIQGTANVAETKWDIHFANVAVDSANTTTGLVYDLGTLDDHAATTGIGTLIDGLTVTLDKPGDKLTVNFDIENAGTIDAKLASFNKHITKGNAVVDTDTADTKDVVNYTITCGGAAPAVNSTLAKRESVSVATKTSCVLTVEYLVDTGSAKQNSQTPGQDQTVNQAQSTYKFDANWQYVQK